MLSGEFEEIDLGVIPSPAGGGALVLHQEEHPDCLVVFGGWCPADGSHPGVIATFAGCQQSIFGYPNDEAYFGAAGAGYGFYRLVGSTWDRELAEFNRLSFPKTPAPDGRLTHFFMGGHDASGQFLARRLAVDLFPGGYAPALREALRRLGGVEADPA